MASEDRPSTTPRAKPSGKKAKPLSQKEQSERFRETARELDVDETGVTFERAMAQITEASRKPADK